MPVAFLAPLALAALGLIAAPVIVHMLRRSKSHRLDFPSLRFLRETPSLVRRLTPPNRRWLLALRIGVIALIALAAARPAWTGGAASSGAETVILLDASASMDRPGTRDAVLAAARDVIGRLGESDVASVAQFDRQVRWLLRGGTRQDALAVLDTYAAGSAAGATADAVASVERSLATSTAASRRIVLISDWQRSNIEGLAADGDRTAALEPIRIENQFGNAFVADATVETVASGESLAVSVVRSSTESRSVARVTVPLADGAAAEGVLVARDAESWTARVTTPDEFDADDVRFGSVGRPGPVIVCDPGAGAPFLAAAARANYGEARVSVASRLDGATLAGASAAVVSSRALDVAGAAAALEAWVREGGSALIFAASPGSGSQYFPTVDGADPIGSSVSLAVSPEDPAALALRAASIRTRSVEAAAGDLVLARDGGGRPVVVQRKLGAGGVTVAGFDTSPESGSLVYDGGFPDVVRSLLRQPAAESREVGDSLTGLPVGAVVDLAGRKLTVQSDGTVRLDAPGIVRVTSGDSVRLVAVNVAASESEPGQLSAEEVAALARQGGEPALSSTLALEASERRWPLWRILLALALIATIAELVYAGSSRRRTAASPAGPDGVALPS
jgi:hypothetical protein